MLIGGIEAGGTKMVCGVADVKGDDIRIIGETRFPTTTPEEVLPAMISWLMAYDIKALGIGCFGPLDLKPSSPTYGYIKATPKPGWQEVDLVSPFARALSVPIALDTDVNGAALAEAVHGAGRGCGVVVYMTVGTGIGAGVYVEGKLLHGLMHPEAGHMLVARHPMDTYKGFCAFHNDTICPAGCLEGYACGPAIEARWGAPCRELAGRRDVWDMEAYYLAQGVTDLIYLYSPDRIILGGGVMHEKELFPLICGKVKDNLKGYIHSPLILGNIEDYIVPPALGDDAGLTGAIELGRQALAR